MIEVLLAIATSSMLSAVLIDSLAETQRFATSSQNQVIAAGLAQNLIDNARNTTYANLQNMIGTYTLMLNQTAVGQTGPVVDPRPIMLDEVNMNWAQAAMNNPFNGIVTETIAPGVGSPTCLTVAVSINWIEGASTHTYNQSTVIFQNGIHNYD